MTQSTDCATESAPADVRMREHYVYRAFDARDRLLYVGCTFDVSSRWAAHHYASEWFPHAAKRTVSDAAPFTDARAAESTAIAVEHPMFNMNEPCRAQVSSARRSVQDAATQVAHRDGWQMNDAHAIGNSTANLIAPALPSGTPFLCARKWELLNRRDWFHQDPLPFVFTGYRRLVDTGWEPEHSPAPRFNFIPQSWDVGTYGNFSREVDRPQAPDSMRWCTMRRGAEAAGRIG